MEKLRKLKVRAFAFALAASSTMTLCSCSYELAPEEEYDIVSIGNNGTLSIF